MHEEAVEEKSLRPRRKPEDRKEETDEKKNLQQADRHARQGSAPIEWDPEGVNRADDKENERDEAKDRGDDRDEVSVELKTAEKPPNERALEEFRDHQTDREQADKGGDPEDRDVVPGEIEGRRAQPEEIHAAILSRERVTATCNSGILPDPSVGLPA